MVNLVLELQGGLPPDVLHGITNSIASTPGCLVTQKPSQGPNVILKVSVAPFKASGTAAAPLQAHNAEAVLQATAWLEHNLHATPSLLAQLQQQGIIDNAEPVIQSPPATLGSAAGHNAAGHNALPVPERPQDFQSSGSSSSKGGIVDPAALSPAGKMQGIQPGKEGLQQQQPLMPLLQRCGVLGPVYPEHDAAVLEGLRSQVWRQPLAPVTEFRRYFGDQVGFYLAYLNALTCWLLAPAAASGLFLWTLGGTGLDSRGLNHPMIPILVVFQLLWSAAGVKLWRRHQALLNTQWHNPAGQSELGVPTPTIISAGGKPGSRTMSSPGDSLAGSYSASPAAAGGGVVNKLSVSRQLSAQPSLSYSHFRGGVPQWAVEAPTATGTRWQFAGAWRRNAKGHWQLQAALVPQLLRVAASIAATSVLLLLAAAVLVACLNIQGLIAPMHGVLYMPGLAALSAPGGLLSQGLLAQVPTVLRVLAVSLYDAYVFGPAARILTGFENRRTLDGFDASLTAKKAALQFIFVFAPVAYVGLAGAGAAAAANDAAGYFKFELLRRIIMEFAMPWVATLFAKRRQAATQRAAGPAPYLGLSQAGNKTSSTVVNALKPQFDPFAGAWDVTRDMGYVMLFASILPWAAPLTLLYTLAKIKQDCMSLLLVYQRPMPRTMRNVGSWNTVLLVQVFMAVITNVFLSGLSSGQLAQLLPQFLVPEAVSHSITAAAAARPSVSTAAGQLGAYTATGWPLSPLNTLETVDAGRGYMQGFAAPAGPWDWQSYTPGGVCPIPGLFDSISYGSMCPAGYPVLGSPVFHAATPPDEASSISTEGGFGLTGGSGAASTHLLLLFALEHLLVLLVVLVFTLVPDDPAVRKPGRAPIQLPATAAAGIEADALQQQYSNQCLAPEGMQVHMQNAQPEVPTSKTLGVHVVSGFGLEQPLVGGAVSSVAGLQSGMQIEMPVQLHGNPLFAASTARKSKVV